LSSPIQSFFRHDLDSFHFSVSSFCLIFLSHLSSALTEIASASEEQNIVVKKTSDSIVNIEKINRENSAITRSPFEIADSINAGVDKVSTSTKLLTNILGDKDDKSSKKLVKRHGHRDSADEIDQDPDQLEDESDFAA